mgnify:CR=1 FL=1
MDAEEAPGRGAEARPGSRIWAHPASEAPSLLSTNQRSVLSVMTNQRPVLPSVAPDTPDGAPVVTVGAPVTRGVGAGLSLATDTDSGASG